MTSMAHLTAGRRGALKQWSMRALAAGAGLVLAIASAVPCAAAQVTDQDIKTANTAAAHAKDAWADAKKSHAKQSAALKKAEAAEAEVKADLKKLQDEFVSAPQNKKEKLTAKIRALQEEANKASNRRASLQTDVTRAEAQAQARKTEADAAANAATALVARQKTEKAEWAQRQAQDKQAQAKAATAPAPAPKAATPAPAPKTAAPAPAPTVPSSAIAQAEASAKQALDQKTQADAVVVQRTQDLANAKDAEARKKADAALKQAEKYAAGKDKDYRAALAALDRAKLPPPAPRAAQVSEPAPWAPPAEPEAAPVLRAQQTLTIPEPKLEEIAPPGTKLNFDAAMLAGDKDIVQDLPIWKEWADFVTFNPVSADDINAFHGKFTKALQEKGYVFAKVTFPTRIWAYGIFLAKVDLGPLGTITVKGNRFYSSRQIVDALANEPGARFNYARVHGDIFDLNAMPDINVDAKLKPSIQNGRRVIDADLQVEDRLPIHGGLELSNTGTEYTNDWRIRSTLQDINLTQHDDVLSAEWLTSPDVKDVNAWSLGYFLPLGKLWSVSLNTSYNGSDIQDVLPQIDVQGRGYSARAEISRVLREEPGYRDMIRLNWQYTYWETQQDISGMTMPDDRRLRLSNPGLGYDYQDRTEKLFGRTFLSISGLAGFAGDYGNSSKADFIANSGRGATCEGDFSLIRARLSRLQRFGRAGTTAGKWSLMLKLQTQLAGDTLPPSYRVSVGGANGGGYTVRGYNEGEISGDSAVCGSLELQTPILANFLPGFKRTPEELEENPEYALQHRLFFILFTDAAWVQNEAPQQQESQWAEFDEETMSSVGAGFRLGFTKYSQMRLDYGYALMDTTVDTPQHGRFHVSLQLQF